MPSAHPAPRRRRSSSAAAGPRAPRSGPFCPGLPSGQSYGFPLPGAPDGQPRGCLLLSLPPSCLRAPRGRGSGALSAPGSERGVLSLPGSAALRVPSRAGFPISLPPSGLEASSPPSLLSGGSALGFLYLPAGMGHPFLLICVSGGSALCYLFLLLPEGLGSPFHSSVFLLNITAGTLPALVPLGRGSPRSLPVPQGTPSPWGLSHPPSGCVFFSSLSPRVRGHLCGQISRLPSAPTATETLPPTPPPGGRSLLSST